MSECRFLFTGSRKWTDFERVYVVLDWVCRMMAPLDTTTIVVVHGAGVDRQGNPCGADWAAELAARRLTGTIRNGMPVRTEPHPADWARHKAAAGPRRNAEMVALGARACFAFPLKGSRGTWDTVARCHTAGIPVRIEGLLLAGPDQYSLPRTREND